MNDILIRNTRPMGGEPADILVRAGRIAAIGPNLDADGVPVEDGSGCIAIPGLVEAHTHLDKTLMGLGWYRNTVGPDLQAMIDNERRLRHDSSIDPHRQSMRHALALVASGTTLIRSHVDIDTEHGLRFFHGVAQTREALRGVVDIQIVAFPQSGMQIRPGTAELIAAALDEGADIVGGLDPAGIDRDPKGQLDAIFSLAESRGKPIDIHLHEAGELGAFTTELILERTRALGLQGRVAISHAFCLGMNDYLRVGRLIDELAELRIAVMTTAPASREVPQLLRLRTAGVLMGAGCDGVRDSWNPIARPDMLDRARLLAMKNNLRTDADLEVALAVCTTVGAEAAGVSGHALEPGAAADMALLPGESLAELVVSGADCVLVIKAGRIVSRNAAAVTPTP